MAWHCPHLSPAPYTVHIMLSGVQCAQYVVQYTVQCTHDDVHCTEYAVHCSLLAVNYTDYGKPESPLFSDASASDKLIPNIRAEVPNSSPQPVLTRIYSVSEISKVRGNLFQINGYVKEPLILPEGSGPPVIHSEKVYVPVKEHPDVSIIIIIILIII